MKVELNLYDLKKQREFIKQFECEFDRDKFIRKLKYSRNVIVMNRERKEY